MQHTELGIVLYKLGFIVDQFSWNSMITLVETCSDKFLKWIILINFIEHSVVIETVKN
jgi:hypothetical protein